MSLIEKLTEMGMSFDDVVDLGNGQTKRLGDCTADDFQRLIVKSKAEIAATKQQIATLEYFKR